MSLGLLRERRRRIGLRGELPLALMPTATVLVVLAMVEVPSHQRPLLASLASSAFLIHLDPGNAVDSVRTLVAAQMSAALIGLVAYLGIGPGCLSGGIAMVATILLMIVLDVMHPPAVATALGFALRAGDESDVVPFGLAVGVTAALVLLQRAGIWLLARHHRRQPADTA